MRYDLIGQDLLVGVEGGKQCRGKPQCDLRLHHLQRRGDTHALGLSASVPSPLSRGVRRLGGERQTHSE